jgi:hypothetical protein
MTGNHDCGMLRSAEKRARLTRFELELGARQRALPDKRYGVIYADPPWRFQPYLREPVTLTSDGLLDGRNRALALRHGRDRTDDSHLRRQPGNCSRSARTSTAAALRSTRSPW